MQSAAVFVNSAPQCRVSSLNTPDNRRATSSRLCRREAIRVLGLLTAAALGSIGSIAAQDVLAAARPTVASRSQFDAALDSAFRRELRPEVEAALIASWGEPVGRWATEVAADPSAPSGRRLAAIRVLGYARPAGAMETLKALVVPDMQGDVVLWYEAMTALAHFPYPELAPFWRGFLNHPIPDVRHSAIIGLGWSGAASDTLLIIAANWGGRPRDQGYKEMAVAMLRHPIPQRSNDTFAPVSVSAGRFVPAAAWLAAVRPYLCAKHRVCQ